MNPPETQLRPTMANSQRFNMEKLVGIPIAANVDSLANREIENPKKWILNHYELKNRVSESLKTTGRVLIAGVEYDFTPYLNVYVYKKLGQWFEMYAPDRLSLMNQAGVKISLLDILINKRGSNGK